MQAPRLKPDGPKVRQRRMLLGLEIADVAARVGISRSFLSRIELHSVPVRARTHKALRQALGCDDDQEDADTLLAPGEDEITKEVACPDSPTSPRPPPQSAPSPSKSNAS